MNTIVCIDEKNGIGKNGNLLYSIPDDMQFFRNMTKGSIVIMGRKTLYSFKNKLPLKNRINIVLTKNKNEMKQEYKNYNNIFFANDKNEVYDLINTYKKTNVEEYNIQNDDNKKDNEVFIIGGESIYNMFIEDCDKLYITKMYKQFEADTFFPDFFKIGFVEKNKSELKMYNDIKYQFIEYGK